MWFLFFLIQSIVFILYKFLLRMCSLVLNRLVMESWITKVYLSWCWSNSFGDCNSFLQFVCLWFSISTLSLGIVSTLHLHMYRILKWNWWYFVLWWVVELEQASGFYGVIRWFKLILGVFASCIIVFCYLSINFGIC